jgi:hypothetical protein
MYNISVPSTKPKKQKIIISYNYPLKYKYYSIINSNNEIQLLYLPEMPIKPPFLLNDEPLYAPPIPKIDLLRLRSSVYSTPPGLDLSPPGLDLSPPGLDLSPPSLDLSPLSVYSTPPGLDLSPLSVYSRPPGLDVSPSSVYSTPPGLELSPSSKYSTPPGLELSPSSKYSTLNTD